MDVEDLTKAFVAARDAAVEAGQPGQPVTLDNDGGTCNLDTPMASLSGMRKTKVEAAAQAAGITVSKTTFFGRPTWFIFVPMRGQANLRTRCAEAAAKALKANGVKASVWYHAD